MKNPVLESTKFLVESPKYVQIDMENLERASHIYARQELPVPRWDEQVFPERLDQETIDFLMVANSINFCYNNSGGEKYSTNYGGKTWKGAFGMFASLKRAAERGLPVLEGKYLKNLTEKKVERIFRGNSPIPMLEKRVEMLREVGQVLCEKYDGHFHYLLSDSRGMLFGSGGVVERLAEDFTSFDDSVEYEGGLVVFNKRAQLAPAMAAGKFGNRWPAHFRDLDELTVFADYSLPASLRDTGMLKYERGLARKVDTGVEIPAGSREELEIRASTVHAAKRLQDRLGEIRGERINALQVDYMLWMNQRKKGLRQHYTRTTNY